MLFSRGTSSLTVQPEFVVFSRCFHAPVSFVSSCLTTFQVSSGCCSFEKLCAHQSQPNRRQRSPQDLSLQLDRRDNECCVVLDVCQIIRGPPVVGTLESPIVSAAPVVGTRGRLLLRMRRDSSEPRERCRLHDSLPLPARCRRHPVILRCIPQRFFDQSLMSDKKSAHLATCTDTHHSHLGCVFHESVVCASH